MSELQRWEYAKSILRTQSAFKCTDGGQHPADIEAALNIPTFGNEAAGNNDKVAGVSTNRYSSLRFGVI